MQPLAYTTSIMSWTLFWSAFQRIRKRKGGLIPCDLNIEAPSCVILCCTALEAFSNEISSLTAAFLFNENEHYRKKYYPEVNVGIASDACQAITQIKNDPKGSFYDRYKVLLKAAGLKNPHCLQRLSYLRDLRDAFVHFRSCDVRIVQDSKGVICYDQEPPEVFRHLKSYRVHGWPVVDADGGQWTLRVSTNAMAAWSLSLTVEAILHVLYDLPAGIYKDFILKRYAARSRSFKTVFEKGKADVEKWENGLFVAS